MVAKASRVCRYLIVILCVFISTGAYAGVIQYFIGGWIGDGIGNIKIFIPGAIQLGCDQRGKAYGIIAAEVTTVAAGTIFWYLSDKEYDEYLSLPAGTPKEEFDRHIKNSQLYGTISITSFALAGAVYMYSVIDAIRLIREGWYWGMGKRNMGVCLDLKTRRLTLYMKF